MRKFKQYLLVLCFAIFITNCRIEPVELQAQSFDEAMANNKYTYIEKEIDGMKYGIWYGNRSYHDSATAIAIVNLTKDKLEVELLQKQLNK